MIKPDLIIRTHRRSLCLSINKEGNLIVHAPKKLNMNDIFKYICEKENWIRTKQSEIENKYQINKKVIHYEEVLFLGRKYCIDKLSGINKIELSDEKIFLPSKFENDDKLSKIKNWYIKNAKEILFERLEYFADVMQVDYSSVSLSNSKNRWGSCDSKRRIKLNFRLIMLPHKVIDFVLIHELAHIIEFNHSKKFYNIISAIMPNYKTQQRCLKDYDYVLGLYR